MSQDSHDLEVGGTHPVSSTYWDCPARYETFHRHQDGRPLCSFCNRWNPAPYPDGTHPKASRLHGAQVSIDSILYLRDLFGEQKY